jgi:hypothetical protein
MAALRSGLILSMCIAFLAMYFIQANWLQIIVSVLALASFLAGAASAGKLPRILGLLMMSMGIAIEWMKGTGLSGISQGLFLILPLLCLIVLAPLLSIPLKLGGYFASVSKLLILSRRRPRRLYAGITGTLFVISPILNLGAVRIIHEFLNELKLPPYFTARSYVTGFACAAFWSPYFASVSLNLFYLQVPYQTYAGYGFGLACLSLLLSISLFRLQERRRPAAAMETASALAAPERPDAPPSLSSHDRKQLVKLLLFVLFVIAVCLVIETITRWSMLIIVSLVSAAVPLLFAAVLGDLTRMRPLLKDFAARSVPMLSNEIVLFMSAGMLAYALQGTPVMNLLSVYLADLADRSFLLFALAVIAIVLSLSFVGIHQIATIGALAMQFSTVDLGISRLAVAMLLILSWTVSFSLSPFSGLNLMVSRFTQLPGRQVGLAANGLHMLLLSLISIAVIALLV